MFDQDEADGLDADAEDLGRALDRAPASPDELMQSREVDLLEVGARQVEAVQQDGGRLPGQRFGADPVAGEEYAGFSGQFGGLEQWEAGGFGPELGRVVAG